MINKRLLIQNILVNHDEGTFFDKKQELNISSNNEKAKFLKHVVALSNSNPNNNSYLIIGIKDGTNGLIGISLKDDSEIQNLIVTYLENAPNVKYENIFFPSLVKDKYIGLITVGNSTNETYFKKNIDKIKVGEKFHRIGSTSVLASKEIAKYLENELIVNDLEKFSRITISDIVKNISEFYKEKIQNYNPSSIVFHEQSILCWSGYQSMFNKETVWSEIDIILVNESVRFFYSAMTNANIIISETSFIIIENSVFGFDDKYKLCPFRKTEIVFLPNGKYLINKSNIFEIPYYPAAEIEQLYKRAKDVENKIRQQKTDFINENSVFIEEIANYYFICYLNGIEESRNDLINSISYLDGSAAQWQTQCMVLLKFYDESKNQMKICNQETARSAHLHIY